MNEVFSQFPKRIITRAPRWQFLGRLVRGVLLAVCMLGVLLAFATVTVAHRDKPTGKCCLYECTKADGSTYGLIRMPRCKNEFVNADGDRCVLVARNDCAGR
jgi:hypothetical protein